MTAPTPAEVEALAEVLKRRVHDWLRSTSEAYMDEVGSAKWIDGLVHYLMNGPHGALIDLLPSHDEALRDGLLKLLWRADLAQRPVTSRELRALLAAAEPRPEPEGERCRTRCWCGEHHAMGENVPPSRIGDNYAVAHSVCPFCTAAPVPSPVAAEERWILHRTESTRCQSCGVLRDVCDEIGEGCCDRCYAARHPAPEPVAAAPDEARAEFDKYSHIYTEPEIVYLGRLISNIGAAGPDSIARIVLAAGYLPPAEVARVVAEAKAEALSEFGDFIATPKHPGLDGPTLYQVYLEAHARADDLRAALVGGPDETGGA